MLLRDNSIPNTSAPLDLKLFPCEEYFTSIANSYVNLMKKIIHNALACGQFNYLQIQDFYGCVVQQSSQQCFGTWESHTRMKADTVIHDVTVSKSQEQSQKQHQHC